MEMIVTKFVSYRTEYVCYLSPFCLLTGFF